MIEPRPAATISRPAAREHKNVPLALTAKHRSQSSSLASTTEPELFTPALLYSTSTRPNSPLIWRKARSTWAASATSAPTARARPPAAVICSVASFAAWALRSTRATSAPSRANRSAAARPIPEPAPVITATRPESLPVIVGGVLSSDRRHAAVDDERAAGHVGEPAGGQQRHRVSDLLGRGHPANRDPGLHLLAQRRLVQPPGGHRGVNHARADRVGPDARRRVVDGDRPGEHERGALGRGVGAPAGESDQPGDRGDGDDVTRAAGHHTGQHGPAA